MWEVKEGEEWMSPVRPGVRWRNEIGWFYRRGRVYLIEEFDWGLAIGEWSRNRQDHIWSEHFRYARFDYSNPSGVEAMASQWIAKAVSKQAPGKQCNKGEDPTLFRDRPAIQEFMTLIVDDEGVAREPSVLMVCATATGVRIGLKDDDAGGWVWREADTFVKALNAIEAALQSGDVKWAIPGGRNGKKK